MRITTLNTASQMLEETQIQGDTLFVKLDLYRRVGDAWMADYGKFVMVPLDNFAALVADRVAILEAAGVVDEKPAAKPKAKRQPVRT